MSNFRKKHMSFFSVIIAVFFVLGVVGISTKGYAAPSANIGVVDFQFLMNQHPDMASARETIKEQTEQAQKDFNDKIATMTNDQDKQAYFYQLQKQLDEKKQALFAEIQNKVIAAVKSVADAKGLAVVVDKNSAIYGGQDITGEVGKKFTDK